MQKSSMTPKDVISLRKSLELGQAAMADLIGMSLRGYQSLESGESPIRPLHILAMERAAEKIAVATKKPMLAPLTVRQDAVELFKLLREGGVAQTKVSKFKLVEIELDRNGNELARHQTAVPYDTKAEADLAAERAAKSLPINGYNDEHGYWWARTPMNRNYRFFVEAH
jgi:transcriptional regulator with XRE-family HTH domain